MSYEVNNEVKTAGILVIVRIHLEASDPKWVNSNYILHGVNSLMIGGLHLL